MASRHGVISEFEAGKEDWTSYTERLQQYFAANEIVSEDKQRAILISVCGAETYQLLKSLLAPVKPAEKTFVQLVELMKNHLQPTPSVIVERFTFHSRSRRDGEAVAVYVAELRKLSEHCGFGDSLNDMLRDRLVCGISDSGIQRRLLSEPDLTFKKAFDLAQAAESAERNVHDLQSSKVSSEKLYLVKSTSERSQAVVCYRCGAGHRGAECRYKDATCYKCGKQGHLSKVCRSKPKSTSFLHPRQKDTHQIQSQDTHQVQPDEASGDMECGEYNLFNVKDRNNHPMQVTATINAANLLLEVDTGATLSIISQNTYETLWADGKIPLLQPSGARLRTYTGEEIKVMGNLEVDVKLNGQEERLNLLVVEGNGPSLLGRDWLRKIELNWSQLHQIRTSSELTRILIFTRLYSKMNLVVWGIFAQRFVSIPTPQIFFALGWYRLLHAGEWRRSLIGYRVRASLSLYDLRNGQRQ